MASHTALVQVFMNLVINAIHAMEDKGGGRIEFTGKKVGEEIHIDVRDTGTGIKDEHIASIFEAFFTTKGERGTGLGLSICKEIIEINHGGSLTVSNHSQGGAVFHISLPIKHENTSEEEDPS